MHIYRAKKTCLQKNKPASLLLEAGFSISFIMVFCFGMVLSVGFLPYIVSDLIMNCVIAATAVKIIPALRKNGYLPLVRQKR